MDIITIIGTGKLGSHLYFAFKKSGYKEIYRTGRKTDKKYFYDSAHKSNIIFICTKDSDITNAVRQLSQLKPYSNQKFIFHTSGALSSAVLKPLADKNTFTGSFHPVQSFNGKAKKYNGKFRSIYIAVEGSHKAVFKGVSIAKKLGSIPFIIREKDKVFHHINSVIGSNYLVTLISQIAKIFDKNTVPAGKDGIFINGFKKVKFFDIYEPLIRTTIDNIGKTGTAGALTGPVERNDYKTIELHLKNLKRLDRELLEFYIYMGIRTIKLALAKKSITKKNAQKLTDLFYKYSNK
jgi:predicted short-subunit dehydrogenase-like oxidoreductase (DUF2520 family)